MPFIADEEAATSGRFIPDEGVFTPDDALDKEQAEILTRPAEPAGVSDYEVYKQTGADPRSLKEKVQTSLPVQHVKALWNTITHPVSETARLAENVATVAAGEPRQITIPGFRQAVGLEDTPPLSIPQIPEQKSLSAKLGAGAVNAGIQFANFFLTPDGFASLGLAGAPSSVQKSAATAFGATMAADAPERYQGAIEAAKKGDWQTFAQETAAFVGEAGLGAHMIKKGVVPDAPKQVGKIDLQTQAEAVEPATAEAVKEIKPPEAATKPIEVATEQPVTPEGKASVESPGPGAASPAEFTERKALDFSNELLPDFLERDKEREVFSEPFAFGRIPILGRLLDPNAKVNNYEHQGLAAYNAARHGVGPAQASYIGSRFGPEIRNAFQADANGDLNVGASKGQSRKISDVFESLQEDPTSYQLNPEQQRVWNEVLRPILESKNKLVKKYDLALTEDANGEVIGHFHRIVTDFPEGKEPLTKSIGQMVGAKIPSQRGRVFRRSEAEGWNKGYKYELDPVKRLVSDIERTYKAIADKRLIDDPVFGGVSPKQFEAQLRESFSEELASGEISEKSFANILQNKMAQGRVYQPGFAGTIFEPKTAKLLNDALSSGDSQLRKTIATVNDFAKALRLGFDLGVGQLQLLPTFFRNPAVWAKANWESLKAIVNPDTFSDYVAAHEQAVRELAQAGSSTGQLQEFLSGIRPGQVITRVPIVGTAAKAFGRQFQTALDAAKIQLWEAWREVTPPDQRLAVIRSIESQLSMGRMESIGVSGRQALTERVALLAPSYYRGAVNFVTALAENGVSGKVARQGLMAFVGGGLALYYGIGKMLGMGDDELVRRLNPSKPEFLQWTTKGSNNRNINFGIGGIHRSLLRLAGNIVGTSVEHPGNWLSLSTDKNPISRWLRGHSAVVPELAFTAFSGRDFMGDQSDIGTITGSALPLTIQQLFRKPGEPPATVKELAISFLGLSAYPESVQKQFLRERDEIAEKRHGKGFESLRLSDQLKIVHELNAKAPFNEKLPASSKQIQKAFENSVARTKRITEKLPEPIQKGLADAGLHVTGYEPSLKIGRDTLLLTQNQQNQYEALLIEEYSKRLAKINLASMMAMDIESRQKRLNLLMEPAKLRARARLIQSLRNPSTE